MSFKYSAFIENSKEAKEWLESIGYRICICTGFDGASLIDTFLGVPAGTDASAHGVGYPFEDETPEQHIQMYLSETKNIDCRGNMQLFKAITAVRDDSDYMQWFTDGIHWEVCPSVVADLAAWKRYYQRSGEKYIEPWKATKDELINHFKSKSNGI